MRQAFLIREPNGEICVLSPYDAEFVEDIRDIPYHAKRFDREQKCWYVDNGYEDLIEEIASRHFDVLWLVRESEAQRRENAARASAQRQTPPPRASGSHTTDQCLAVVRAVYREEHTLGVFPPATVETIVQAAYRAQAKRLHPDLAGSASHDAMVALNRAYETLLQRCRRASA